MVFQHKFNLAGKLKTSDAPNTYFPEIHLISQPDIRLFEILLSPRTKYLTSDRYLPVPGIKIGRGLGGAMTVDSKTSCPDRGRRGWEG